MLLGVHPPVSLCCCPPPFFLPTSLSTRGGDGDSWSFFHCPTEQPTSACPLLPLTSGQEAAKCLGDLMPAINLIILSVQEKEEPQSLGWTNIRSPHRQLCSHHASCNGHLCY